MLVTPTACALPPTTERAEPILIPETRVSFGRRVGVSSGFKIGLMSKFSPVADGTQSRRTVPELVYHTMNRFGGVGAAARASFSCMASRKGRPMAIPPAPRRIVRRGNVIRFRGHLRRSRVDG